MKDVGLPSLFQEGDNVPFFVARDSIVRSIKYWFVSSQRARTASRVRLRGVANDKYPRCSHQAKVVAVDPIRQVASPAVYLCCLFFVSLSIRVLRRVEVFRYHCVGPSPVVACPADCERLVVRSRDHRPGDSNDGALMFQ